MRHATGLVRFALAVLLAGLAMVMPAMAQRQTISGEVTYRERIALPPGATLRVELIDLVTGMATRARAEGAVGEGGQVPLSFALGFDTSTIIPGRAYGLVATIRSPSGLRFETPAPVAIDPLAPPSGLVVLLRAAQAAPEPPPPAPAAEAEPPPPPPELLDTLWRARRIGEIAVAPGIESTLSIAADLRAGGRGGCNNYFAQAGLSGQSIRFSAVAATRMACASSAANEQEARFFAALSATRSWRIVDGGELVLVDASGVELVRFVRSPF